MKQVEFKLFLSLWNRFQNQSTPDIHFKIADWLEECWETGQTKLLLQAFRSCGKSTIIGLFASWLIYTNPDIRILVLAADSMLARKMVRNVKRILERHPLTADLKPEKLDQWGTERFTVKRRMELRDPTMLARGITSNITGSRADIIICDDVEVPKTSDTALKRRDLREKLDETSYVLSPQGTQIYVGTPHSWFTIYADRPRKEIGETHPYLDDYQRLTVPVLNADGQSAWLDRFSLEDIQRIKTDAGPNKFKSQMMLIPVNIAEGTLDPENLQFYDEDLYKDPALKSLYIKDRKLASVSAWWDPAFGKKGGDRSVVAVVFTDDQGEYWLHHMSYLSIEENTDLDEATQQCRSVAAIAKRFYLPSIALEINGIGRFLPNILRRELSQAKAPCSVKEVSNSRAKDLRILEAFDAVLAAKALHVHQSVQMTPFVTEMQEWKPGVSKGHDDGLDAVAGALSLEPVRLKRFYPHGKPDWLGTSKGYKAKTEFDV